MNGSDLDIAVMFYADGSDRDGSGGRGSDEDSLPEGSGQVYGGDEPGNSIDDSVGSMNSTSSRNPKRNSSYDDENDAIAEKVLGLVDTPPSHQAIYLGKVMVEQGIDDSLVKYAVENLDMLKLSRKGKGRAASMLRKWARNNSPNAKIRCSVCPFDDKMHRLKTLMQSLESLVKVDDTYIVASRLMRAQASAPVFSLEEDLSSVGRYAGILPKLPDELRAMFYRIVDDSIDVNCRLVPQQRRRYSNLGNIIKSLEPFTRRHSEGTRDLAWKVKDKDTRNILYELYVSIGSLPHDTPHNVLKALGVALDLLPVGGAMDDTDVKKIVIFARSLANAMGSHTPLEMGCFLDLHSRSLVSCNGDKGRIDIFYKLARMINKSTHDRAEAETSGSVVRRRRMRLEDRVETLGLEYLAMSSEIGAEHGLAAVRDFAAKVQGFNHLNLSDHQVLDAMELYKRGIIDSYGLQPNEDRRLGSIILLEREHTTRMRQLMRSYEALIQRGPSPCPDYLKDHLKKEFGADVERVWDFRDNQLALYYGSDAADAYAELSRHKIDTEFVRRVVIEARDRGMLERHLIVLGGGCGYGDTEIAFYEALREIGIDAHLDLIDKSRTMLEKAAMNCLKRGIDACVYETNLETLNHKDLKRERQMILTLWGGTFFNWMNRYSAAERYATIFNKRDRRGTDGAYLLQRYYGDGGRKKDILLVEGDTRKDISYYKSRLSKLFLARGLSSEYDLDLDALMRDGQLCHTLYVDQNEMEMQCIYLVTKDKGHFKANDAIIVIDSGTLFKEGFDIRMESAGFRSNFIEGPDNKAVALCTTLGGSSVKGR